MHQPQRARHITHGEGNAQRVVQEADRGRSRSRRRPRARGGHLTVEIEPESASIDWTLSPPRSSVNATITLETTPNDSLLISGASPRSRRSGSPRTRPRRDRLGIQNYSIINNTDEDHTGPFKLVRFSCLNPRPGA